MKRILIFLIVGAILFVPIGCATFSPQATESDELSESKENKDYSLVYVSPNIPSDKSPIITAGFNLLEDARQEEDVSYMSSVREKVSSEVLISLTKTRIFDEVHFPPSDNDDIMIEGKIKKFKWRSYDTIISYIPGLNVLPFLGFPSTRTIAEVEIYLECKNNKTKEVISMINESSSTNKTYTMYSFKPDKAKDELSYCFKIVLNKIEEEIRNDREKIVSIVSRKVVDTKKETSKEANNSEKKEQNTKSVEVKAEEVAAE